MNKKRKQAWPDTTKATRRTPPASTFNPGRSSFIPEDIISAILVKLPTKTLLRFKCLSTRIRNLIQSPHFVASQHRRNRTGIFLLAHRLPGRSNLMGTTTTGSSFSFPFLNNPIFQDSIRLLRFEYVGSWNGLVCLNLIIGGRWRSPQRMVLWNPATSEYSIAPIPPPVVKPWVQIAVHGFGYDPVSNEYKSIRIIKSVRYIRERAIAGPDEAEFLTWGQSSSWRRQSSLDKPNHIVRDAVTSKGRVSWKIHGGSGGLFSFNVGQETFELIPPPPKDYEYNGGSTDSETAFVRKGSLAMLVDSRDVTWRNFLDVWLFNDDDRDRDRSCCWSRLFTVGADLYSPWGSSVPEYIWKTTIPGRNCWNMFLIYEYDHRFEFASMTGNLSFPPGYEKKRAFEFVETVAPVPGVESYQSLESNDS
ncbi:Putative F-box protein At1g19160 [Linum grandiflorum]